MGGGREDVEVELISLDNLGISISGNSSETTRARQQEAQDRSTGPGPHRPGSDQSAVNCGAGRSDGDGAERN